MSKFVKFYEWLCSSITILMLIGLMFVSVIVYNAVFAGQALTNAEVIVGIAALIFDYAVIFTWLICSVIRSHQLKGE